jgi:hypothetical protein
MFLVAAAPKASATGYSMTISSNSPSTGVTCDSRTLTPTEAGTNLYIGDIAACADGAAVTIGDGGPIAVESWPTTSLDNITVTLDGDATTDTSMSGFGGLTVEGADSFSGAVHIDTSGGQSYAGAVTLGGNTTFSASDTDFSSSVDSATSILSALTIAGSVDFSSPVGALNELASVTQTGGGTVTLSGSIDTPGAQSYSGAVSLATGAYTMLASAFTFGSTVDGQSYGAANVTLTTPGAVSFGGNVGAADSLASLDVAASGTITVDGLVSTTGAQTYGSAVELGGDAQFDTSTGDIPSTRRSTVPTT